MSDESSSIHTICNDDDDDFICELEEYDIAKPINSYNSNINGDSKILYADEVPLPEMCFEIEHEDEISDDVTAKICFNELEKPSRMDNLISPIPPNREFDTKSPYNPYSSDCGYSSQGSPTSSLHEYTINDINNEDFNFLELFPSLA